MKDSIVNICALQQNNEFYKRITQKHSTRKSEKKKRIQNMFDIQFRIVSHSAFHMNFAFFLL